MKVALFSQSLFALPLAEAIPAAAAAGFGALELACAAPHLDAAARVDAAHWAARLADAGLAVSALSLFSRFSGSAEVEAQVEEAARYVDLAPAFGTRVVKVTPGPPASAAATEAHRDCLAAALERLVRQAEAVDVRLAVETHMRQLTDTAAASRQLLDRVASPRLGLTVDFSNLAFAGDDPVAAMELFGDRVYNTHVKNGHVGADESWCFTALDQGWTRYPEVLAALHRSGYDGYLTIECLQPEARTEPVATARRERQILERLLAAAGAAASPPDPERARG